MSFKIEDIQRKLNVSSIAVESPNDENSWYNNGVGSRRTDQLSDDEQLVYFKLLTDSLEIKIRGLERELDIERSRTYLDRIMSFFKLKSR